MTLVIVSSGQICEMISFCLHHQIFNFAWLRRPKGIGGVDLDVGELLWLGVFNCVNHLVADHDAVHELATRVLFLCYYNIGPSIQWWYVGEGFHAVFRVSADGRGKMDSLA